MHPPLLAISTQHSVLKRRQLIIPHSQLWWAVAVAICVYSVDGGHTHSHTCFGAPAFLTWSCNLYDLEPETLKLQTRFSRN
ncbi:hypothetical protein EV401DRAFT_1906756 [Pisolithus croceorrhizus]|nr:hypothetical protein EV401DRAFT_1906756 [Pisolithus croceorrhizus]